MHIHFHTADGDQLLALDFHGIPFERKHDKILLSLVNPFFLKITVIVYGFISESALVSSIICCPVAPGHGERKVRVFSSFMDNHVQT